MAWGNALAISFVIFLILISIQDIKTMLISDFVLISFSLLHIGIQLLSGRSILFLFFGALSGFIVYFLIYIAGRKIYGREAFGLGDVLLISSIGIVLGGRKTVLAAFLAFYIALLPICYLKLKRGKLNKEEEIPFAPSVCLSSLTIFLYGDKIIDWLTRLLWI